MKRRRAIILAGAVVVLGVSLAMVWPRDEGPEHNGRKLSELIQRAVEEEEAEAKASIRAIGGKGTPYLLKWIQYETPEWRSQTLYALVSRLPSGMQKIGILRAVYRREDLAIFSMVTLTEIEPEDGKSVVAELERLSTDLKRPETALRAEYVLRNRDWGQ